MRDELEPLAYYRMIEVKTFFDYINQNIFLYISNFFQNKNTVGYIYFDKKLFQNHVA